MKRLSSLLGICIPYFCQYCVVGKAQLVHGERLGLELLEKYLVRDVDSRGPDCVSLRKHLAPEQVRRPYGLGHTEVMRLSSARTNASGTALARSYRALRFSPAMEERHIAPPDASQSTSTAAGTSRL